VSHHVFRGLGALHARRKALKEIRRQGEQEVYFLIS
jgi:hypothetical protein